MLRRRGPSRSVASLHDPIQGEHRDRSRMQPLLVLRDPLRFGHRSRGPDWQLQRLAQSGQVVVTWTAVIRFPEIDTRRADADLFGNFGNRQATSNTSVTKIMSKRRLSSQDKVSRGRCSGGGNVVTSVASCKPGSRLRQGPFFILLAGNCLPRRTPGLGQPGSVPAPPRLIHGDRCGGTRGKGLRIRRGRA
jgi:hypothetical protein